MAEYQVDKARLGEFVAEERKRLGLTQRELAGRLYVSDKAVSKWERGLSVPDVGLLIPLADTLGVTVTELLEGRRIRPAAGMEMVEVEQVVKKALFVPTRQSWFSPLFLLLLADIGIEWRLFSLCYSYLCLPYYPFALLVRLLFLAAGYCLVGFPSAKRPKARICHAVLTVTMLAIFLLEFQALKWTNINSAFILRDILFAGVAVLSVLGAFFCYGAITKNDVILQGHLLTVVSSIFTFLYEQAFFEIQEGREYMILSSGVFVYVICILILSLIAQYMKKKPSCDGKTG